MERHVKASERHGGFLELGEGGGQPSRQDVALAHDADQHDVLDAAIALHDLVRDAGERAADLVRIHHRRLQPAFGDAHESSLSRSAMRTWRPLRA